MAGSIRPVVYRDHRLLRWSIVAVAHIFGNALAASIMGLLLGAIAYVLSRTVSDYFMVIAIVLGSISLLYALDEAGLVNVPYLQRIAQVPASWQFRFSPPITAFLYGLGLGSGVTTRIVTGTFYVMLVGAFFYASPLPASICFLLFGVMRAIGALAIIVYTWDLHSENLHAALQRVSARVNAFHIAATVLLSFCSGYWLFRALIELGLGIKHNVW